MSNYELYVDKLTSMIDLTDIEDAVKALKDDSNTVDAYADRLLVAATFQMILQRLQTDKKCPKCGKILYLSDIEDYDYLCTSCQENFYEVEVE